MAKKRLLFTLLYQQGAFFLSRNFRLQRVGDLRWLNKNLHFGAIATAIDELVILDVSRDQRHLDEFIALAGQVSANCFVPLTLGGGITSLKAAETLIKNGADKLILNTALARNPELVRELVAIYGSQCIVASVDFRIEGGAYTVYVDQGKDILDCSLSDYLDYLRKLKVGEIYLNSIDRDGTGQGYCLEVLDQFADSFQLPVILAGGAGNKHHLLAGLVHPKIDAVATANLFNFVGDGLPSARTHLIENGLNMARWYYNH